MKVVMGVPDAEGCGHYRVRYPGAAVQGLGHDVSLAESLPVKMAWNTTARRSEVAYVEINDDVDVVVLQRPLRRGTFEMIPLLQKQGVAVVVDVDDDFSCVDPKHRGYRFFQPRTSPESNRVHLQRACAMADLVTVTTPALARRYGSHGRVLVLPNCVPAGLLAIADLIESDGDTVGWAGHVETHPNDLQAARGGVAMAVRETDAKFLNVGSGNGVAEALGFNVDEVEATGPVEFADYPYAVARFDVGLAPLADTAFNHAKSALKGLEYAAVGVPFVASDVPDYRRVAGEGIGEVVPAKAKSWRRAVRELLTDDGRRAEAREMAREAVRALYTYEGNGWRWAEAWEQAQLHRRVAGKPAVAA